MTGKWKSQCEVHGCWRERHVLSFEPFHGIFPRNINFGDVDGIVEYMGEFLLMEWKTDQALWDAIEGTGQDLLHERLVASGPFTVLQVVGQPGGCEPHMWRCWTHITESRSQWFPCNQASFKQVLMKWREKVEDRNRNPMERLYNV